MDFLIYRHRKWGDYIWDATGYENEARAFKSLFIVLDKEVDMFVEFKTMESEVYKRAKEGNTKEIKHLLNIIAGYEYGDWRIEKTQEYREE